MTLSYEELQLQQRTALADLIKWAGTPSRLAMLYGYTPPTVWFWTKHGRISKEGALRASEITGGLFTFEQLRPDLAEKASYNQCAQ